MHTSPTTSAVTCGYTSPMEWFRGLAEALDPALDWRRGALQRPQTRDFLRAGAAPPTIPNKKHHGNILTRRAGAGARRAPATADALAGQSAKAGAWLSC